MLQNNYIPLFLLTKKAQKKEAKATLRYAAFVSKFTKKAPKKIGEFARYDARPRLRALDRRHLLKKGRRKLSIGVCASLLANPFFAKVFERGF